MLKDLDLEKIMTAQAKNLSGGQKRKLSVGIAILGDPKVPGAWNGQAPPLSVHFSLFLYESWSQYSSSRIMSAWAHSEQSASRLLPSDPALGRAHSGHGPLLPTPGVVAAEEPQSRKSHRPQHTLHGWGWHSCWYELLHNINWPRNKKTIRQKCSQIWLLLFGLLFTSFHFKINLILDFLEEFCTLHYFLFTYFICLFASSLCQLILFMSAFGKNFVWALIVALWRRVMK